MSMKSMNKPTKQIGGTHYELPIQPIQFIEANNIPFHEANIIKYITRWRKKNGIEDLRKAQWYINRLIELEQYKEYDNEPRSNLTRAETQPTISTNI